MQGIAMLCWKEPRRSEYRGRGQASLSLLSCRLSRIREASGSEVAERLLKEIMGTADFDIEEYDRAMAAAFDDTYYEVGASPIQPVIIHTINS